MVATRPAGTDDGEDTLQPPASETRPVAEPGPPVPVDVQIAREMFDESKWVALRERLEASAATRAAADDPNEPLTHLRAGDTALRRGDYDAAVASFRRAAELAPGDTDVLQGLAVALTAGGRYRQALGVYRTIIDRAGDDETRRTARFNLAVALIRLRRLDEAQRELETLLAADPHDARARFNLAALHQYAGRLSAARRQWEAVIDRADGLAPRDQAVAYRALGDVLMDLQLPAEAADAYASAARIEPDSAVAWSGLSRAARAAGSLGRAVATARQAAEADADDPARWRTLGNLLLELHRASDDRRFLDDAVAAWRRSLSLDPTQDALRERLAARGVDVPPATRPTGD